MLSSLLLAVGGLVTSVAAVAHHECLAEVPSGWRAVAEPAGSQTITLSIGLQLQNTDQLESKLLAVSTPGSPEYGQYLDTDEVNALFKPAADSESAVRSWLKDAGVTALDSDGTFINFATDVTTANSLLNATFAYYSNSGTTKLRTTQYSIPEGVSDYIDIVTPTTFFGKTASERPVYGFKSGKRTAPTPSRVRKDQRPSKRQVDASCQTSITPACLHDFYSVGNYTPSVSSGSRVGFASFLNESARYEDLALFDEYFGIAVQNFSVVLINNGTNRQTPDPVNGTDTNAEANGDVEIISGLAHPLPITEFITGGSPPFIPNLDEPADDDTNEPYVEYYRYLLSQPNSELPQVISASYGDDEQTVPESYAKRTCFMIGMMGLRGISLLGSSGDNGIGAPCQSNDGLKTPEFTPQFPSTCPWFTSVGGTQNATPEIAWLGSGGGFSNYFSQASYQKFAVEKYLNEEVTNATRQYYSQYTNFSGRAFPDIAAHSATPRYVYFQDNALSARGFAGTSAACPATSAIIALLNDARLKAGKPALGFLNPLIYGPAGAALNDVTLGNSIGCNGLNFQSGETPIPGASVIPWAAWNATKGWDPVTGMGTPNFEKLKSLVLSL